MKKLLVGIAVAAILAVPASVAARINTYDGYKMANTIYQFNCDDGYVEGKQCNQVSVFDDQDNKCYVTSDPKGRQTAISCVKN